MCVTLMEQDKHVCYLDKTGQLVRPHRSHFALYMTKLEGIEVNELQWLARDYF